MRLRDYINNKEFIEQNDIQNDSYIIAKQIIELIKKRKIDEAMIELNNNLSKLYSDLSIDSFCFLIDYYINNTEVKYHLILKNSTVPTLLIDLSCEIEPKNKIYFINKVKQLHNNKKWKECLCCIEVLIEKTDVDKIGINNYKVPLLIYAKEYKELKKHLEQNKEILYKQILIKGYLNLAKNYELNKKYEDAYIYYKKVMELDLEYKIPHKIMKKLNINNKIKTVKCLLKLK